MVNIVVCQRLSLAPDVTGLKPAGAFSVASNGYLNLTRLTRTSFANNPTLRQTIIMVCDAGHKIARGG